LAQRVPLALALRGRLAFKVPLVPLALALTVPQGLQVWQERVEPQAQQVSVQRVQRERELRELLVQLGLLALTAQPALRVLVLPAQRGCKAPLVLSERQELPALALTAQLAQLAQPALVPLVPLVQELRVQQGYRVPLELSALAEPRAPLALQVFPAPQGLRAATVQQEQQERSVYLVQPVPLAQLALSVFQELQAFKAPQVLQAWMALRELPA
tara:strand:- start:6 stop:647 length:642 start_codon:yes stop_codon:yes gene_type:complete